MFKLPLSITPSFLSICVRFYVQNRESYFKEWNERWTRVHESCVHLSDEGDVRLYISNLVKEISLGKKYSLTLCHKNLRWKVNEENKHKNRFDLLERSVGRRYRGTMYNSKVANKMFAKIPVYQQKFGMNKNNVEPHFRSESKWKQTVTPLSICHQRAFSSTFIFLMGVRSPTFSLRSYVKNILNLDGWTGICMLPSKCTCPSLPSTTPVWYYDIMSKHA